ncbi:extracellular serine carboxypeptidase like protein [Verticillium longisporum]|nr:extracellular serine carboxypeptidase like protein [Verticillium longisporum]
MERSWFWQVCTEWGYFQTGSGSTTEEPFLLMGGGAVHHWDENGVSGKDAREGYGESLPPSEVRRVQKAELAFVKAWVDAWSEAKAAKEDESLSLEL